MKDRILITGASGFIGSFLVEEALNRNMEVWAGVRQTSSKKYLSDSRIHFACLDLAHSGCLREQLSQLRAQCGGWDYVIHCAGATKCLHAEQFYKVNYEATVHLVEALQALGITPRKFVYLSSLSVFGPIHEADYQPICADDVAQPNTAYGKSKVEAEQFLRGLTDFPVVVFRPTGVYGPREKDYFLMAKSIKCHVDFSVGYGKQVITFVYVKDLAQAIFLGLERAKAGTAYFVSDGGEYDSRAFSDLIQGELGNPWVCHVRCPLWVLRLVSMLSGWWTRLTGKPSTLNMDKYHIMKQRNWKCDIHPLCEDLGYVPQYPLKKGVAETIAWYKKEGWL